MDIDALITVTILDTVTWEERTSASYSFYWWSEGNGSCDCNRELLFGYDTSEGYCLGCHRYLIVATSTGDLMELNNEYPAALIAAHNTKQTP